MPEHFQNFLHSYFPTWNHFLQNPWFTFLASFYASAWELCNFGTCGPTILHTNKILVHCTRSRTQLEKRRETSKTYTWLTSNSGVIYFQSIISGPGRGGHSNTHLPLPHVWHMLKYHARLVLHPHRLATQVQQKECDLERPGKERPCFSAIVKTDNRQNKYLETKKT